MNTRVPVHVAEHGQTDYDAQHRIHGEVNSPLNAVGRREARRLGRKLKKMGVEHIYASPLLRTQQTAKIAARTAGIKKITTKHGLRALNVGHFHGINEEDAGEKLGKYFKHPNIRVPGGETVAGWRKRIFQTMNEIAARHPDGTAAAVTHSNVAGAIDAHATGKKDGLHRMENPPGGGSVHTVRYPIVKH